MKLHMLYAPRNEHRQEASPIEHEDLPWHPRTKRRFDARDETYFDEETGLHHIVMTTGEVDAIIDLYYQLIADAELMTLAQRIQLDMVALKWNKCRDQRN